MDPFKIINFDIKGLLIKLKFFGMNLSEDFIATSNKNYGCTVVMSLLETQLSTVQTLITFLCSDSLPFLALIAQVIQYNNNRDYL